MGSRLGTRWTRGVGAFLGFVSCTSLFLPGLSGRGPCARSILAAIFFLAAAAAGRRRPRAPGTGTGFLEALQFFQEFGDILALGQGGQPNQRHFEDGDGFGSPGQGLEFGQKRLEHASQPGGAPVLGQGRQGSAFLLATFDQPFDVGRDAHDDEVAKQSDERLAESFGVGAGLKGFVGR